MSTRRTNPSYQSSGEAAQESARIDEMLRGIINKGGSGRKKASRFIASPRFWSTYKGQVIKAIVIDHATQ